MGVSSHWRPILLDISRRHKQRISRRGKKKGEKEDSKDKGDKIKEEDIIGNNM